MILILSTILSLVMPAPHPPEPPKGWLDCGFTANNAYRCKP